MAYKRKTRDLFVVQGHHAHGWEDVAASYDRKEARNDLKAYRDNEPGAFRIVARRERIQAADG